MERQRLIRIIENKGAASKEETNELWDIVRAFPYFQTARLLLAKSFHDQDSIHFHSELKVAAAYASDRKALFQLINQPKEAAKAIAAPETNIFVLEQEPAHPYARENKTEAQFIIPEKNESSLFEIEQETPLQTEAFKETPEAPSINARETVEEKRATTSTPSSIYDEPATTNEEIIRKRLNEILSKNKPEEQQVVADERPLPAAPFAEKKEFIDHRESVEEQKTEPAAEEIFASTPSALDELPAQPKDEIEGLELETIIEENYLRELEKLPELAKPIEAEVIKEDKATPEIVKSVPDQLSFVDWLKYKNAKPSTFEEVADEPSVFNDEPERISEKPVAGSSELINKFIATSPRIVPVKKEFYSPANMARISIIDNEAIVSETLARIYFDQQNYHKARSCYVKLALLYPEKSTFFAPLIEKIDNLLKEQT